MAGDEENPNARDRPEKIVYVEGSHSLNNLVEEINRVEEEWNDLYEPIGEAKVELLKQGGLKKVKGAKFHHVLFGIFVQMVAEYNVGYEDLAKMI
jgi:acid phosphatase family membrane protein YuiD